MPNVIFELEKLRITLLNKGLDRSAVDTIVRKAGDEINQAIEQHSNVAMDAAIEAGVAKRSSDFINELMLDPANVQLRTESGNTEFTTPPYPNLHNLLHNAKPLNDGSGVYKIIPVGGESKTRKPVSTNIYDAQKKINAERVEAAQKQYAAISPKGSKRVQFRTATSKQNAGTQWVVPAQTKSFTEELKVINRELSDNVDSQIRDIIRSYEEGF